MLTIVPTIDVEGTHGEDPFSQLIIGEIGEPETWGVHRLSQTFQDYGVRATFFVDCYEHTFWGNDKMEEVCQKLVEANQDVQLHTHPAWRDDIHDSPWLRTLKRTDSFFPQELDLMAKLSLSQQVEVLEFGADLIQKWVGYRPEVRRSWRLRLPRRRPVRFLLVVALVFLVWWLLNQPTNCSCSGENRFSDGLEYEYSSL